MPKAQRAGPCGAASQRGPYERRGWDNIEFGSALLAEEPASPPLSIPAPPPQAPAGPLPDIGFEPDGMVRIGGGAPLMLAGTTTATLRRLLASQGHAVSIEDLKACRKLSEHTVRMHVRQLVALGLTIHELQGAYRFDPEAPLKPAREGCLSDRAPRNEATAKAALLADQKVLAAHLDAPQRAPFSMYQMAADLHWSERRIKRVLAAYLCQHASQVGGLTQGNCLAPVHLSLVAQALRCTREKAGQLLVTSLWPLLPNDFGPAPASQAA